MLRRQLFFIFPRPYFVTWWHFILSSPFFNLMMGFVFAIAFVRPLIYVSELFGFLNEICQLVIEDVSCYHVVEFECYSFWLAIP